MNIIALLLQEIPRAIYFRVQRYSFFRTYARKMVESCVRNFILPNQYNKIGRTTVGFRWRLGFLSVSKALRYHSDVDGCLLGVGDLTIKSLYITHYSRTIHALFTHNTRTIDAQYTYYCLHFRGG